MRILITDENMIWTHENPALEPYSDIVLVICLNGKAVTDKYECFVTPYKYTPRLGMGSYGVEDEKYTALESVADDLNGKLHYHDDIIILGDNSPQSIYPFMVLKERNEWNHLHLCAMTPLRFELKARQIAYNNMLQDLSSLSSLLYINSSKIISELTPGTTISDFYRITTEYYVDLLPRILYGIQERSWRKAFFDFYSKSYLPLEKGYDMIESALRNQEIDPSKIEAYRKLCTFGLAIIPEYPANDVHTLRTVESLVPRPDGKTICNYLRELRIQLASANNIPFSSEECPSVGPCAGTCAKCDSEAEFLLKEMHKKPAEERIYPTNILERWEELL